MAVKDGAGTKTSSSHNTPEKPQTLSRNDNLPSIELPINIDRAKAARSMFWSAIENGSLTIISLLSLIIYSRLLSPQDFGIFSVVFAFYELVGVLTSMLFHDALVQRTNVTNLHYDTAFSVTVLLCLFMMVGAWLFAPTFGFLINQPAAGPILAWISLCFPIHGVTVTIVARQRRAFAFRQLALRSLIGRLGGGALGITAAFAGMGLWSLVVQQLGNTSLSSIVLWWTCDAPPRLRFRWYELKQLIVFGGTSVLTLFLTFANKRVYTILTGILLGSLNAGLINFSFRLVDMFWTVAATAVSQVALPMLSNLQSDPERLKRAYNEAVNFSCIVLFPCFVGLSAIAPEVVELLFGNQWLLSNKYVSALALLILIQAPRLFVTSLFTAVGRPYISLFGVILQIFFMLGMMLFIKNPTTWWIIGTWIGCEVIVVPVSAWLLWRATGFTVIDQFKGVLVPFMATLLMFAFLIAARLSLMHGLGSVARLCLLVPFGAGVYIGALFLIDRSLINKSIVLASYMLKRKT